jgi:hypothetical protein
MEAGGEIFFPRKGVGRNHSDRLPIGGYQPTRLLRELRTPLGEVLRGVKEGCRKRDPDRKQAYHPASFTSL